MIKNGALVKWRQRGINLVLDLTQSGGDGSGCIWRRGKARDGDGAEVARHQNVTQIFSRSRQFGGRCVPPLSSHNAPTLSQLRLSAERKGERELLEFSRITPNPAPLSGQSLPTQYINLQRTKIPVCGYCKALRLPFCPCVFLVLKFSSKKMVWLLFPPSLKLWLCRPFNCGCADRFVA